MKVSTKSTTATIVRQFEITEGHPVVLMAYSLAGKKIRVESGEIKYTWKGGRWVVFNEYAISLVGVVLKKDGSDSLNQHSRIAGAKRVPSFNPWELSQDFLWLQPIVDLLRPKGDLSMITLTETKVS